MKRVIIIGATSGIGREVAKLFLEKGYRVGIAGRRGDLLEELRQYSPENVVTQVLDVTTSAAARMLQVLLEKLGGMDLFFLASGVGWQNPALEEDIEMRTAETNVCGFIRMLASAYHYFAGHGGGHIAVISSIAGTKGLGPAPAYSATKRFQNTYIDALAQLARMQNHSIRFTDIRPGFVDTPLLNGVKKYPMLMDAGWVAKQIVEAIEKQKRLTIIDWRYRILVFFWRHIPTWLWERISTIARPCFNEHTFN